MNFKDPKIQIISIIAFIFLASSYLWYSKIYSDYSAKIAAKETQRDKELLDLHNVKQKAATLDESTVPITAKPVITSVFRR
jgi:hypothetical protein